MMSEALAPAVGAPVRMRFSEREASGEMAFVGLLRADSAAKSDDMLQEDAM